jgi:hypothetical protein
MIPALVAVALLASQPPAPSARNEKRQPQTIEATPREAQPDPHPRGTTDDPIVIRTERSKQQTTEDQQDREDDKANRRYNLWLSVITALVLGFQVWLLVRQNQTLSKQTDLADKQTVSMERQTASMEHQATLMAQGLADAKESSDTAKENADAAKANAEAARDLVALARTEQRAWVGVSKLYVTQQNGSASLRLEVKNSGQTPALDCQILWRSEGRAADVPYVPEFTSALKKPPSTATIFPGLTKEGGLTPTPVPTQELIEAAVDGRFVYYVWVKITYRDVYGEPHTTRYFGSWRGHGSQVQDEPTHNDAT